MATQITFRNMQGSPALEQEILSRVAELETLNPRIHKARVVVEVPHRHHLHGNQVHVRIELALPGEDVIVAHEPSASEPMSGDVAETVPLEVTHEHRIAVLAVREAFDKARRRLERVAKIEH